MSSNDDILRALGRLEGKVDAANNTLNDHTGRMNRIDRAHTKHVDHMDKELNEVQKRIVHLEKRQYGIFAVAGVIATCISILVRKFF